ncbi:MAG: hypothetical protein QM612_11580 [Thermomonas sp.]|uniref:hypothetical protein n=1 Tax=Thermomonas sp. TaxID=1971895 RepID=UPI0039E4E1D2
MLRAALLLLLLTLPAITPRVAHAQVKRCALADGTTVYTDRKCEDIGGSERIAPPRVSGGSGGAYLHRTPCARNVQDLGYSLSGAIQSGDANQVASLYDWAGMSADAAYRLMSRLDAIASRTVVDVQPVYAGGTNEYGDEVATFDEQTGELISKPRAKPRLVGLRVEQVLADGHTPSRTVFGVQRRMGCLWLRL